MAGPFDAIDRVLRTFETTVESASTSSPLTEFGLPLLFSIMTMLLIFQTLKTLLEGSSGRQIMAEALHLCILGSFAILLINDNLDIKGKVLQTTEVIGSKFGGPQGGSDMSFVFEAVYPVMGAVQKLWESELPSPDSEAAGNNSGGLMQVLESVGSFLGGLPAFALNIFMKLFAMGLLIIGALIACMQFMVSQVLIHIAMMLAPIFIPFMVWEKASFIFDGWLRFFIKAAFHKVIGLIMLGLLSSTVSEAVNQIPNIEVGGWATAEWTKLSALLAIVFIGAILCYMMWQIGSIADGLISGSASGGLRPRVKPRASGGQTQSPKMPETKSTTTTTNYQGGQVSGVTTTRETSNSKGVQKLSTTTDGTGNVVKTSESNTSFSKGKFFKK